MILWDFVAQAFGIVAMCTMILSYQFKSKRALLLCQLLGAVFFAVNLFMLGALVGGIMNIIAVIRAMIYMKKDSIKISIHLVSAIFIAIYALSYALTFTLLGTEPTARNLILELLPIIGMITMTFAFSGNNPNTIRICGFINSPCWLIYHVFNDSIGGLLCEVFSITSVILALIRLRSKDKKATQKENVEL